MILDSLVYVMKAETSGVKEGLDESEAAVGEFSKSMEDAEKTGDAMSRNIIAGIKKIGGALLATVAISKTFGRMQDFVDVTGQIDNLSQSTGDAVEDI